jgi:hypothetical protein
MFFFIRIHWLQRIFSNVRLGFESKQIQQQKGKQEIEGVNKAHHYPNRLLLLLLAGVVVCGLPKVKLTKCQQIKKSFVPKFTRKSQRNNTLYFII